MISVLRLGHRIPRDRRTTTHVALVARAFGADCIMVTTKDPVLEESVRSVVEKFGGDFTISTGVKWRKAMRDWRGTIVHLTMYGERLQDVVSEIDKKDVMVVVGGEKVPSEVYEIAHHNVAVGNQPHSEVAALAVFLDHLLGGGPLEREFKGRMRIVPSASGKIVVEREVLPSRKHCLKTLRDAGCNERVIEHCKKVSRLARKIASLCGANENVCEIGGLLHDIGRGRTHDADHGYVGGQILREKGFPEPLAEIVERHVGAGLTRKEAKELGMPPKSLMPQTLEQKVVAHADNLVDEGKIEILIASMNRRGLGTAAKRIRRLHNELSGLCGINLDEL